MQGIVPIKIANNRVLKIINEIKKYRVTDEKLNSGEWFYVYKKFKSEDLGFGNMDK